jgi:hypothetical protein
VSLQPHAQILASQSSAAESGPSQAEGVERLQDRQQKLRRCGVLAFAIAILTVLVTTSYKIITDVILAGQVMLGSVFLAVNVAVLIGVALQVYARVLAKAESKRRSSQPAPLAQSPTTTRLPPELHPESVASVTEHTTELLEASEPEPHSRITARNN